jgi:hypothetical protein
MFTSSRREFLMKNLSKDEILSLYVNKVQVLKEIISSKSDKHCNECYENSEDENTSILLEIKEIDVLEKVMGYESEDINDNSN